MSKTAPPHTAAAKRLRILFYLPVVTPWWFANIVVHLIRNLARAHDVHVMVPPLWRNTGLGADEIPLIADLDQVHWHVLDGPDHPQLRTNASGDEGLLALVQQIDPQITLCRSADIKTPAHFPGIVRYIMEGAAPPFALPANWIWLSATVFDHGIMPPLSATLTARLDALAEPHWTQMLQSAQAAAPADFAAQSGLPSGKTIIGLALEYEHEENFFSQHHLYPDNAAMVAHLAAQLPDDFILAVTNHPLTELHGDTRAVQHAISASCGKAVLLHQSGSAGDTTLALVQNCDGMIVGNSKVWATCAAMGTPMLRLSQFVTDEWVSAYREIRPFLDAIVAGTATKAGPTLARRWFTFHIANHAFDPARHGLLPDEIISRAVQTVAPENWTDGLARYRVQLSQNGAQAA